jgi:hypothetical protein
MQIFGEKLALRAWGSDRLVSGTNIQRDGLNRLYGYLEITTMSFASYFKLDLHSEISMLR